MDLSTCPETKSKEKLKKKSKRRSTFDSGKKK